MSLPIIVPIPIFFLYLLVKFMTILTIPFALGLIVRLQAQGVTKEKIAKKKISDKTPPVDPSPSPDGEDKPEDSYWKRFKRWCSDHSLAIGLGIGLVAATLIYIYRKDISDLVHGSDDQASEGKKSKVTPPLTEEEKKHRAALLTQKICDKVFFKGDDYLNGATFTEKSRTFSNYFNQIRDHYDKKTNLSDQDKTANRIIKTFQDKYSDLFVDPKANAETFLEKSNYVDKQLAKKPSEQTQSFKRSLAFLLRDQESHVAKKMEAFWVDLLNYYLMDVKGRPPSKVPEQE